MKKSVWKKLAGMGLVLMLSATALAGCGGGKTEGGAAGSASNGAAAGAGTLAKIKERDKFVVGVKYDLNLFGLKDPSTGNVEGFDIDIAKAIAKKVLGDENKIELKEVTSKTRIPMLKNGEIDAIIATMTITEERKKEVDFSDVYFMAGQSLLVKKDSPINSIKDLQKGMKVLTAKGSTSAKNIRESAPDAEVLEFENYAEAFTALKAGQGDALTTDNALLYGMAKQDPNYRVTEETFTEEPYGIAINKGDAEFVKTVNDVLKEMKENGEYDKIYEKWIGEKPKK
ncbi:glutamine ABC transporter substrate-binding protein [Brevibacillus agri]|uniref:Amino acid ABC transporter substrate-binding protein n=1 Tax=Brevibacillus agri TaxID=51101 RepID=A0A3M8AC86_9BACL|nr:MULTISPECIES: transporter substrate-binding domain-containing protein [Brevibacillus]ELK39845.1 glutamine ABC transporter substrate-binding protein [Brevibacillus agri BAB-2500]EJL44283.1 periplasmic component of amino acid ABC-type transporter/signal transduction system [Brevibacillus sp. CF112]MBG9563911.1 amino acid ABC transporter substrate-binding protein [Brevibacillus agri]MBY0054615.1 transporter substrate-binding domain-containing protein [Brevibacillus agri]MCG5254197.1 transporte